MIGRLRCCVYIFARWSCFCWLVCFALPTLGAQQPPSLIANPHNTDVLFVFYDAGETLALMPVAKYLHAQGRRVSVLLAGTAVNWRDACDFCIPISSFQIPEDVDRTLWQRGDALAKSSLDKIYRHFAPATLVTGVVSVLQLQFLDTALESGAWTAAFNDSLSTYFSPGLRGEFLYADEYWVSNSILSRAFLSSLQKSVEVVGHPTLMDWVERAAEPVRQEAERFDVMMIGGYGAIAYVEAVRTFVNSAEVFPEASFSILLHPKSDGGLERRVIDELGSTNVRVLDHSKLDAAFKSADLLVGLSSTMLVQALFARKQVVTLGRRDFLESTLYESGWAFHAKDGAELKEVFTRLSKKSERPSVHLDLYGLYGTPRDSVKRMAERVAININRLASGGDAMVAHRRAALLPPLCRNLLARALNENKSVQELMPHLKNAPW